MPPVFDRQLPDPHPYDKALATWLQRSASQPLDWEHKAMARNIMHDHRVSPERERLFEVLMNQPRTGDQLRDALIDYKYSYVQGSHKPHFIDETINLNNIVTGLASTRQSVNRDIPLVRVLDLTGMVPVFQWAKRNDHPIFSFFPSNCSLKNVDKWIGNSIKVVRKEKFVEEFLNVLNDHNLLFPFEPSWAAAWRRFEPFIKDGPNRWLEVMGMHRETPGRWLMLLTYTVREAGTLVRPTQLEAGWGPRHFPSPPRVRNRVGGHPMDLNWRAHPTGLLSEFIHRQVKHEISHWRAAGRKLERTSLPTSRSLVSQRTNHHNRLIRKYGRDVSSWMPETT